MNINPAGVEIPTEITFVAHAEPVGEGPWFGPDDPYGLECVVPIVGPSSYLMWVKLARLVTASADPVRFVAVELFRSIGLGVGTHRNSAGVRTLSRMAAFGLLYPTRNPALLAVPVALAPLPSSALSRLTSPGQRYHHQRTLRPVRS